MQHLFWLLPGRLAGRPGPDVAPWNLHALRAGGIHAILSVNDGFLCSPMAMWGAGLEYCCSPLSDNLPPRPGDEEQCIKGFRKGMAFIEAQLTQHRTVLVHCSMGRERTGLFLATYLVVSDRMMPDEAIRHVRAIRPTTLQAEGWEALALRVMHRLRRFD
jgi:hypothetical protein